MKIKSRKLPEMGRFVEVVHWLRRKCPWDRKQTHRSLIQYLIEEAYETIDAIQSGDRKELREELGDLLLQVILHAEIADQAGHFSLEDVARDIAEKMIRRHPHVFAADKSETTAKGHARRWTELKGKEQPKKFLLDGTPESLPALQLAQRYGEKAASVGFDWEKPEQVLKKVDEELEELRVELRRRKKNRRAIEEEMGDVFFTLSNLCRHLNVGAESCARQSALKFKDRLIKVEKRIRKQQKEPSKLTAAEWDAHWRVVK